MPIISRCLFQTNHEITFFPSRVTCDFAYFSDIHTLYMYTRIPLNVKNYSNDATVGLSVDNVVSWNIGHWPASKCTVSRETNRERLHDSFDLPLVPKYRKLFLRVLLYVKYLWSFSKTRWFRTIPSTLTMKRKSANKFPSLFSPKFAIVYIYVYRYISRIWVPYQIRWDVFLGEFPLVFFVFPFFSLCSRFFPYWHEHTARPETLSY